MKSRWVMGALAVPLAWGSFAGADTLEITLHDEFSEAVQPQGSLIAKFEDTAVAGTVTLTLTNNLVGTEYVSGWYFNYLANGVSSLPVINFGTPVEYSGPTLGDWVGTVVPNLRGTDETDANFKADGDGFFDIRFDFPTTAGNGRFTGGEKLVYTISADGLSASDFNFESLTSGGSKGPFVSAAHIQAVDDPTKEGVDTSGSGWISGVAEFTEGGPTIVPLPPVVLGGALLMGFIARGRTRSKI